MVSCSSWTAGSWPNRRRQKAASPRWGFWTGRPFYLLCCRVYLLKSDCHHPIPSPQRGGELSWFPSLCKVGARGWLLRRITPDSTLQSRSGDRRRLTFNLKLLTFILSLGSRTIGS